MRKVSLSAVASSVASGALYVGLLEFGLVFSLAPRSLKPTVSSAAVLQLGVNVAAWFLLLLPVAVFLFVATRTKNRAVRSAVKLSVYATFILCCLFLTASWGYRIALGQFLDLDVLRFAAANSDQLLLHFLQTAALYWLLPFFAIAIISLLIALRLELQLRRGARVSVAYLLVPPVAFFATAGFVKLYGPLVFVRDSHPLTTFIGAAWAVEGELHNSNPADLLLELKKKTTYKAQGNNTAPVIVVLVESLRADLPERHPEAVPFLRSLIAESLYFLRPYAASSHSNYGDLAFWYSQYPLRGEGWVRYSEIADRRGTSVFQVFKDLGFQTAYISSQNERWGEMIEWLKVPEVDYFFHSEDYHGPTWENEDDERGLIRLIREKITHAGKIEDSETLRIADEWIDTLPTKDRFFLGMNLQNTHYSYVLPPGAEEPFGPVTLNFPTIYYGWPEEHAPLVKRRYLTAVYHVDRLLEQFVARLKEKGIWDDCYFLVLGDSGEEFYEHGFGNHSGPMYDRSVRTFGLLKPPKGVEVPAVLEAPVNHVDLLPTLLDLLGVTPPPSFQGMSVLSNSRQNVYLHANAFVRQDGLVAWPWKYLVTHRPDRKQQLFHLAQDSAELHDRAAEEPEVVERLDKVLGRWRSSQLHYHGHPMFYQNYAPPALP